MKPMVERVANAVLRDLTGRRGFRQSWDECDEGIQDEIREAIGTLAIAEMRTPTSGMILAGADFAEPVADIMATLVDAALNRDL